MSDEILFEVADGWGTITLNAPQRLNALSQAMCAAMAAQLDVWRGEDAVKAVLIKGAGERAFCAGGDIRTLYAQLEAGDTEGASGFFETEYRNNWRVGHFPKPFVALIDGIVMGGGVGVSAHGRYRVASERAQFAMPECGIGLYPDVGATHLLPRLPGAFGMWLGLTGARIGQGDMMGLGLATHAVASDRLPALEAALRQAEWLDGPFEAVEAVLERFHEAPIGERPAIDARHEIDAIFSRASLDAILSGLEALGTEWAQAQLAALRRAAPLSLMVTHRALREGAARDLSTALDQEYALTRCFIEERAFMEGVRAQVIDKDRNPKWDPASLAAVTPAALDAMFRPAPRAPYFGWERSDEQ